MSNRLLQRLWFISLSSTTKSSGSRRHRKQKSSIYLLPQLEEFQTHISTPQGWALVLQHLSAQGGKSPPSALDIWSKINSPKEVEKEETNPVGQHIDAHLQGKETQQLPALSSLYAMTTNIKYTNKIEWCMKADRAISESPARWNAGAAASGTGPAAHERPHCSVRRGKNQSRVGISRMTQSRGEGWLDEDCFTWPCFITFFWWF